MPVNECNKSYLGIKSLDVLKKIQQNDPSWQKMVAPEVAELILKRELFGLTKK
jgi:hypothetical protein